MSKNRLDGECVDAGSYPTSDRPPLTASLRHAMSRHGGLLVLSLACASVLVVGEVARLLQLDVRNQVAPVITAGGIIGAVGLFYLKEASDRRRKTLECFEKQLYDKDLRISISTVVSALKN